MYKEKLKQIFTSPAIGDLWRWSGTARRSIGLLCLMTVLSSAGSLVITLATKGMIDGASTGDRRKLITYIVLLVATSLSLRLCGYLSGRLNARCRASFRRELQTMFLKQLMRKQYAGLSRFHSGELSNRLFSDVGCVLDGIMGIPVSLASMLVSFFGGAAILISMDWRFVILLVLGGSLGAMLMMLFREPMKKRHKAMQESEGRLRSFMQELLGSVRIVKACSSERRMELQADIHQQDYYDIQIKHSAFSLRMNTFIGLAFQLSWLVCMVWGSLGIYRGTLTYGSLAAIIQLVNHIQWPIANAAGIAAQMYGTMSSAERIKELTDLPEEETGELPDPEKRYAALREIRLNHLTFSYGGEDVLRDMSAVLHPGEFVAVTGPSGGGKTTLFQLLLGIYSPTEGSIDFVFENGSEVAGRMTRNLFGYVPQGNYLFSGTLRDNLTMFCDGATDGEVMEAARLACIDEFILGLEKGLDTEIGERGLGLSEGQAQRVVVGRMLLSRAPILLLDESTSALDEETEARLLENIRGLKSKTCLIVTHRRAALGICQRTLRVKND